jgi:hypothetical protein
MSLFVSLPPAWNGGSLEVELVVSSRASTIRHKLIVKEVWS